jgi:hypothetical protein
MLPRPRCRRLDRMLPVEAYQSVKRGQQPVVVASPRKLGAASCWQSSGRLEVGGVGQPTRRRALPQGQIEGNGEL